MQEFQRHLVAKHNRIKTAIEKEVLIDLQYEGASTWANTIIGCIADTITLMELTEWIAIIAMQNFGIGVQLDLS